MKTKLVFDTTDANTIADSDSVGAYVRSADGTLITKHTIGSNEYLDTYSILADDSGAAINDANPLPVDLVSPLTVDTQLDGDYDAGTNSDPDSAGVILHDRVDSPGEADQNQRPTAGQPNADDIDPANIHAMDSNAFGHMWDGSAWDRMTGDASGNLNVHLQDSSVEIDVSDAALANTGIANASVSAASASTAESAVASALANRKYLWIYNNDNREMYIGDSSVTESNGFPVPPSAMMELRAGASIDVNFISPKAGHEIRTLELS